MMLDSVLIMRVRLVNRTSNKPYITHKIQEAGGKTAKMKNYWSHFILPKSGHKRPLHKRHQ
jgi:hypothetical protein